MSRLVASFGPPRLLFLTRPIPCRIDEDALVIRFYAAKPIAAEEELTIFYGSNLWFTDPNEEARPSSPPETEDNVFANLSL